MTISILQLSDIHFKNINNSIMDKIDNIFNSIKNEIDCSEYLFMTFTGDISYSGKTEEYIIAESFINELTDKITGYKNIKIKYIFTPGNHDCHFENDGGVRDIIIKSILEGTKVNNEIINNCTKVQNNYFNFIRKFEKNTVISQNIFTRYEYELKEYKIAFNSYNLAWASKIKETQSDIVFPLESINKEIIQNDNIDLTISIFHHPLHWLQHTNMRQFKELINSTSNIVMTGHEHTFSAKQESLIDTLEHIEYIEAGVLQERNKENSSFNLLNINLKSNKQDIMEFTFRTNLYEKKNSHSDIVLPFHKKTIFQLKEEYKELLNRMNLKITHPNKSELTLEDIFIYPNLQIINDSSNKNTFIEINSDILKQKEKIKYSIIYGAETSGKTSLSRVLQLKYKRDGLVPLLINGKDIKSNDISSKKIKLLIERIFKNQYQFSKNIKTNFEQIEKNQILLLIDDFNSSTLNSEYKSLFIKELINLNYKNILLFSHESLQLEATTEGVLAKALINFKHYSILEFGHTIREKLIKKWISIGKETTIDKNDLIYKTREKADSINKTIGYNIVPSYPIYLLTLLQAMEANETSSLAKSSYGYYYEFLIMKYLNANVPMEPKDITTIFTYTSSFAFKCLSEKQHLYNKEDLLLFNKNYCTKKRFTPSFDINNKLIQSNILSVYENEYKFSHDYIYYFFVAKYLSDNITKESTKDIIRKMCKRLYRIEFANIIMFLIHHSPQDFILETIIYEAKIVFSEINEFQFSNDELVNINSSIKDEKLKLENRTLEESRNIDLNNKDNKKKSNKNSMNSREIDFDEDIEELNQFATLNLAFKIIEILGEITKNYSGSLDGEIKHELISETYSIGLRSLKSLIEFFEINHDKVTSEIKDIIEKKHYVTDDKINETVSNMIFSMASSISTGIVKKIAKAIASKDLREIYISILNENPTNNAIKIINNAIELDFKGGLNIKKVEDIHKELNKNNNRLADSVLKRIVLEHIYMYEIEYSKKQSICAKLNIDNDNSKREMLKQKNKVN